MKVSDESTIVLNDGEPVQSQVKDPVKKSVKKGKLWQGVVIGGVSGIMLGSSKTVFAGPAAVVEPISEETVELVEEVVVATADETVEAETSQSVGVATGVNDDMSFSEAFEAARAEVGPGGVFVWNGNVYSTYNEDEWNSLTDDQKEEFLDTVYDTDYIESESAGSNAQENHEASNEGGQVEVLSQEVVTTEDGNEITVTRVEIEGHYGEYYDYNNDGQAEVLVLDVDDNGTPDIAMVDDNGDGYISDSEIYEVTDSGLIAMNDPNPEDQLYDGMPDYANDADTSSFA